MSTKPKIRLLVADDQEIIRSGVKGLLAGTEIEVVAEATSSQAAVKLALEKEVGLVLLDKEHVQHLLRKIGVVDRTQAAVWAVRNGLG